MRFNKFSSGAGMALGTIWSHKLRSLLLDKAPVERAGEEERAEPTVSA